MLVRVNTVLSPLPPFQLYPVLLLELILDTSIIGRARSILHENLKEFPVHCVVIDGLNFDSIVPLIDLL